MPKIINTLFFISLIILLYPNSTLSKQITFEKTFGGENTWEDGLSVKETKDGGYIILGSIVKTRGFTSDMYILKTDSNGKELWSKTLGGIGPDWGRSVFQTKDGGYLLLGHKHLIKIDSNGKFLWDNTYGGRAVGSVNSIKQTSDGGYILAGGIRKDIYLVKVDSNGNKLWSKTFGEEKDSNNAISIEITSDGGYMILGSNESFATNRFGTLSFYLVKTDSKEEVLWSKIIKNSEGDFPRSMQKTSDGGYMLLGSTSHEDAGSLDVYLVKTDSNGNVESSNESK